MINSYKMLKSEILTKDQAGFVQTPDAEISPVLNSPVPWWIPAGFQPPHPIAFNQLGEDQQNYSGNKMNSEKGMEANIAAPSSVAHQQKGHFEVTLAQPMISTNPPQGPHPPQLYGLFTAYGPHQPMGPVMLPMSLATDDGTVYVNPKQYHGILRRRKSRAKAASKVQPPRNKPYIHESRHLHAMRRPRGVGGRFLTSEELESLKETSSNNKMTPMMKNKTLLNDHHDHQQLSNPSRSSSSEVLQSEKALNPNPSGSSEVTSLLYGRQFDWFQAKHPQHMTTGTWDVAAAADHGCCDFLKV